MTTPRRSHRTMQSAFGPYTDHRLHPMPEYRPSLLAAFIAWLLGSRP